MNKKEFCNLLFRYIDDGFTMLDIETDSEVYGFNFDEDTLLLRKYYFEICGPGLPSVEINYKKVENISC